MGGILGTTATMAEPEHEHIQDPCPEKSGYNSTVKRNLAAAVEEGDVVDDTTKVTNEEPPCSKKQRLEETPATLAVAAAAAAAPVQESTTTATAATATAIATVPSIDPVVNRGGKSRHNNKTTSKQNKNQKIKTKHMDPRILKVRKDIQEGCRTNNLFMAMLSYEEAIQDNIRIEAQSYYNLLNLCDGLDREERGLHVGSPKLQLQIEQEQQQQQQQEEVEKPSLPSPPIINILVDLKQRQEYIFKIKDRMQSTEINLPLNETAYSAILKILSKNKEFVKAEEILKEAELVQQCKPKLRLYSSLLYAYCEYDYNNGNNNNDNANDNKPNETTKLIEALQCWKRLRQRAKIIKQIATKKATSSTTSVDTGMELTEREYLSLMKCSISYNNNILMEDILSRLAEDIPIPCKNSISIIIEWFTKQNRKKMQNDNQNQNQDNNATVQKLLDEIRTYDTVSEPSPRMGPIGGCDGGSGSSWSISNKCSIDIKTGKLTTGCLKGYTLQPVPLSDSSFNDMIKMNELIVVEGQISGHASKFQGGKKGKKRNNNNNNKDQFSQQQQQQRQREWNYFNDFLSKNCSTTNSNYDVVIDGANIGYYKQNFMNSPHHVNYEQIDWIVRYFTYTLNKRVLLVIHNRHFTKRMLPSKYQYIIDFWMNNNILYQTPAGMNDDWFWMHAALKYKSLVVTNDEMRDHHFQMLAPKFFLRWKERHQIHFDFGNPLSKIDMIQQMQQQQISIAGQQQQQPHSCSNSRNYREIILKYPNVYSRRIQRVGGGGGGLVVPLTMVGDENRFLDGCHVASDEEPAEELYLCIRPNIVQN